MSKSIDSSHRVIVDYIYRPWITKKDGSKIYAWQYGKKAFRIPIYADGRPEKLDN